MSKRHKVRSIFTLIGLYFRVNLASAMEYRSAFILQAFGMALSNGSFVFFWWVAFNQIGTQIGGYDFPDVMPRDPMNPQRGHQRPMVNEQYRLMYE